MKSPTRHQIHLGGRTVEYRVIRSKAAQSLRVRVGPRGVEVVQPTSRRDDELSAFLKGNRAWILDQLERVKSLRGVQKLSKHNSCEILFRGQPTLVRLEKTTSRRRGNLVYFHNNEIVVRTGMGSRTSPDRSLENWLRKQARAEIERQLVPISRRLKRTPGRIYVMGQRTKWGNCSSSRNLSFNWRLILAPEFVFRYLVTHEAVHLAIPDHSAKFWLTVKSYCMETERAKQWLNAHGEKLSADLEKLCAVIVEHA